MLKDLRDGEANLEMSEEARQAVGEEGNRRLKIQ